jgi:hypothetical protein
VHSSPLGMLIHGDYGLWHAYCGALAFSRAIDLPGDSERPSPCESCRDRPCLTACPVSAVTASGETGSPAYDVDACVDHVQAPRGADCSALAARRATPARSAVTVATSPPKRRFTWRPSFAHGRLRPS